MVTIGVVPQESNKLVTQESITLNVNGRRYKFSVGDGIEVMFRRLKRCWTHCESACS
jgi:hypothetical protein